MSEIQKAIDDGKIDLESWMKGKKYSFDPSELKSLLEQVAKKAYWAGHEPFDEGYYVDFEDWWKEQNLTFNEG